MNAITPVEMEGVVERFDDLGELEEGWTTVSKSELRDEEITRKSATRVRRAFLMTVFILLLLNSAGLVQLVQGLSIGPVQDTVIVMSETWHEEMERHGVADILSGIRSHVTEFVQRPWDDVLVADPGLRLGEIEAATETHEKDRPGLLRGAVLETSGS